jgi:hypothetical protein
LVDSRARGGRPSENSTRIKLRFPRSGFRGGTKTTERNVVGTTSDLKHESDRGRTVDATENNGNLIRRQDGRVGTE